MKPRVFLCSDLDRTLLPNGPQPESPTARPLLRSLAARPELVLAYVSGRHEGLLRQAIEEYAIPVPRYAVGDVGSTIFEIQGEVWHPWVEWSEAIAPDWDGARSRDLAALFTDLELLRLQEPEKQNTFKLSYYTPMGLDRDGLFDEMHARLGHEGIKASVIWSVDEQASIGLLDVLPASATKVHAVEFLMARQGFSTAQTVFAGDSGNDLPVVTSGRVHAVLVRNAHADVIEEAQRSVMELGAPENLYIAQGGFLGMNGNYSAGVLEGLAHFIPETRGWLEQAAT